MSWVWRSLLSRPRPRLLSSLWRSRHHDSQLTTVLGSNNLIGSRGYASNSNGSTGDTTKRHLYVVLDDHKDGFSVHKLDLSGNLDDGLDGGATGRLTQPPVLRVALATLGERAQFAALGSSIVATGNTIIGPALFGRWMPDIGGVLIYDTKTTLLTVTPHLPAGLTDGGYKAAMVVGNGLYMVGSEPPLAPLNYDWVDDWDYGGGSLHCLTTDPLDEDQVGYYGDEFWGWELLSDSSPWIWSNYRSPPKVPFLAEHISAYGAHAPPPGAAVQDELLVSLRPTAKSVVRATYSFSTASREWTRRADWHLPVFGHAHYDGHLGAWVGLHALNDGNLYGPHVTDGRLCVGNVMSTPSEWKVGKEKIFRLDGDDAAGWRHVDAKLLQIGGISEYCFMERLRPKKEVEEDKEGKGKREEKECWGEGGKCLLRLTSFHVERGQDGNPMATARRLARSYEVSWHSRQFNAQAFWM